MGQLWHMALRGLLEWRATVMVRTRPAFWFIAEFGRTDRTAGMATRLPLADSNEPPNGMISAMADAKTKHY
ncbi:hypothetical protein [Methylobacterium oxalidis]|uniref:Uncharacterized protein n=1 Tax=Methylobacterium oxalidis TaxID=944322 RepID=A0A512JB61_9HYPH|nr:hypothetical protein [Methylobacterium oxalidis]GEP07208.1 hypothetical protein MOX02_52460 [Methylobacterium oxalidis]GJE31914.1 hypothetical protein LDDCCGHA_2096 [Methylobacterium oxalidis]